jgi:hypothetical protein
MNAESELALLARYIMSEIPGEPRLKEGPARTAIRLLKTYRSVLRGVVAEQTKSSVEAGEAAGLILELLDGKKAVES